MMQAIPNGIWTKLLDYDVELIHHKGHTVVIGIEGQEIKSADLTKDDYQLRLLDPTQPVPLSGRYVFGSTEIAKGATIQSIEFDTEDLKPA